MNTENYFLVELYVSLVCKELNISLIILHKI